MGSDAAMVNASAPAISKDLGKKKKNNRSARLKQCKLDARREQWLSQVKNKSCKLSNDTMTPPSPYPLPQAGMGDRDGHWDRNLKIDPKTESNDGPDELQDSDLESPFGSSTSSSSGTNFMMKNCNNDSSRSSISSGSSSRSVNEYKEEEEIESGGGEDGSLDDWEAIADALTTTNDPKDSSKFEKNVSSTESTIHVPLQNVVSDRDRGILKKPDASVPMLRAWRPDDAFRPQSLPSLSKHRSFPTNMERKCGNGGTGWINECFVNQPSSCPICCEDLDPTDSSFFPCPCGFHLCLFCHKRILEADGRCPGCRKPYNSMPVTESSVARGGTPLTLRISRSCSMSTRS